MISREIGARRLEGVLLGSLGAYHDRLGQKKKAIEYYEQVLVISRDNEIGDRGLEGNTLKLLGYIYDSLGQTEKGIGLLEQALRIGEEIKDAEMIRQATEGLKHLRAAP